MHHVPDTSDLPNTVLTVSSLPPSLLRFNNGALHNHLNLQQTAHSSMIISPSNFLNGDPSRGTIHQTRINVVNGTVTDALTFGAKQPSGSVDLSCTAPNLRSFIGEEYIRKYPYEPDAQQVGNLGAGTVRGG